jgi:hypothetical protein
MQLTFENLLVLHGEVTIPAIKDVLTKCVFKVIKNTCGHNYPMGMEFSIPKERANTSSFNLTGQPLFTTHNIERTIGTKGPGNSITSNDLEVVKWTGGDLNELRKKILTFQHSKIKNELKLLYAEDPTTFKDFKELNVDPFDELLDVFIGKVLTRSKANLLIKLINEYGRTTV